MRSEILFCFISCAVIARCTLFVMRPTAQSNASPIYGVTSVNQLVTERVDRLRAQLGNEIAIKAFKLVRCRSGTPKVTLC